MKKQLVVIFVVIIIGIIGILTYIFLSRQGAPEITERDQLSDDRLFEYMRSSFDKEEMAFKTINVGIYHNTEVIAEFVCGDICPQATRRIVRYNVTADKCRTTDGVIVKATYPVAIAVQKRDICVPKILQTYEQ